MNDNTKIMYKVIHVNPKNYRFKTISDFKFAMKYHSEVAFEWNGLNYSITHPDGIISVCESYKPETEKCYDNPDEALEYVIDGRKLREIITKVKIWSRTI